MQYVLGEKRLEGQQVNHLAVFLDWANTAMASDLVIFRRDSKQTPWVDTYEFSVPWVTRLDNPVKPGPRVRFFCASARAS